MKKKKKSGGQEVYPESLKIAVAKEWLKGEKGYGQLAEEYGLVRKSTPRHFVLWYKKHYPDQEALIPVELSPLEKEDNIIVRKQLVELQKKLEEANLKIASLNTTIDVAEKTLAIDIRKKSGSKQ
mgnify:CR=1 FL=1